METYLKDYLQKEAAGYGTFIPRALATAKAVKKSFGRRSTLTHLLQGNLAGAADMNTPTGQIRAGIKGAGRVKGLAQDAKALYEAGKGGWHFFKHQGGAQTIAKHLVRPVGEVAKDATKALANKLAVTGGGPATAFLPKTMLGKVFAGAAAADMALDAGQQFFVDPRTGKLSWDVGGNFDRNTNRTSNQAVNNIRDKGILKGTAYNAINGAGNPVRNIMAAGRNVYDIGAEGLKQQMANTAYQKRTGHNIHPELALQPDEMHNALISWRKANPQLALQRDRQIALNRAKHAARQKQIIAEANMGPQPYRLH